MPSPRAALIYPQKIRDAVAAARARLEAQDVDLARAPIEWRYARIAEMQRAVTRELAPPGETFSDKLDRVLTHKSLGHDPLHRNHGAHVPEHLLVRANADELLKHGVSAAGGLIDISFRPGICSSLLVDAWLRASAPWSCFLPQILLLFLFIGFLEDTGYMARAAFLMDRLMSKVGLHGKSFIPMLSSFACAIPGIMATRTIETPKDRLVTILVAPLMSCSARLPIYTLLIGACTKNP